VCCQAEFLANFCDKKLQNKKIIEKIAKKCEKPLAKGK
jgi:hypothetical protein